jgi:hypothetical protein
MPTEFRIGLIATVLVLATVRMRKSLRIVGRSVAQGEHLRFAWSRWYHLSIAWALIFFCLPFAAAVAFPDSARELSVAIDRYLGDEHGASHVSDVSSIRTRRVTYSPDEIMKLEISHQDRTQKASEAYLAKCRARDENALGSWGTIGALGGTLGVLLLLASFLARMRRPGAMVAASIVGLGVSFFALNMTVSVATGISGVLDEAQTVQEYADGEIVAAEQATWLAGPARVVGRPSKITGATEGFLYFHSPSGSKSPPEAPWKGFELGPLTVGPAERGQLHIMKPSVRLTPTGREILIRDDEDVVVMGFVADGTILPRDGYPIIIAPASARGTIRRLSHILFGAPRRRTLYMAMLQVASVGFAAWFLSLLLGALSERIAARFARSRAQDVIGDNAHPSITQLLRYGDR